MALVALTGLQVKSHDCWDSVRACHFRSGTEPGKEQYTAVFLHDFVLPDMSCSMTAWILHSQKSQEGYMSFFCGELAV